MWSTMDHGDDNGISKERKEKHEDEGWVKSNLPIQSNFLGFMN